MDIHAKLSEQGLALPELPAAVAQYVPALRSGNLIFVSGQLCTRDGQLIAQGAVPTEASLEAAQEGARQCVLNALAAVDRALEGDWSRFVRVVRLGVFVNSAPGFNLQHQVANGGSDLLARLFGEAGQHVRAAVGAAGLPLNAAVEAELTVEVRGD